MPPSDSPASPTACVAASPEGALRYWPNVVHQGSLAEVRADLGGDECTSLISLLVSMPITPSLIIIAFLLHYFVLSSYWQEYILSEISYYLLLEMWLTLLVFKSTEHVLGREF